MNSPRSRVNLIVQISLIQVALGLNIHLDISETSSIRDITLSTNKVCCHKKHQTPEASKSSTYILVQNARLEFTFDSYPRKSRVQDLNLFKSNFGSENACVKDKMRIFQFFKAALLRSAALFKMCLT